MSWLVLAVATIAACELLRRLPLLDRVREVAELAARARRVIAAGAISDHWKERVLPAYAAAIARASVTAFAYLLVALAPFAVVVLAGPWLAVDGVALLLRWEVVLGISVGALAYLALRGRTRTERAAASDYTGLDRMLHRLALASRGRGELLFDLERMAAPAPPPQADAGRHVFVVGLARAGTTTLLRALHESGQFASLTYRDMPFVLAPNLWQRLSGGARRQTAAKERAHGDGILVDFDSPEALEEPFWRTFCGAAYVADDALVPHVVDEVTGDSYRRFVANVLARYQAPRYLAKNNNGVLRVDALIGLFPAARIVVPFRQPLEQAASLKRQHERFVADPDPFTAQYMSWLAHHEFGPAQRPFVLAGRRPVGTPDALDYWLSLWCIVYDRLLTAANTHPAAVIPIAYEDLCAEDNSAWRALALGLGIPSGAPRFERSTAQPDGAVDPAILDEADALYARLRSFAATGLACKPMAPATAVQSPAAAAPAS